MRKWSRIVAFSCGLWAAFTAVATASAQVRIAQAQARAAQAQARAAQKVEHAALSQAQQTLSSVRHTLQKADHDYGGHRVAAIRDIKAAQHQLNLAMHHHHKRTNPGTKGPTVAQPEPQVLSDAQLTASVPVLQQAATYLANANHDFGGHRANAIRDLNAAIGQLQLALKYRQGKKPKS
jgi:hypothetical protein